MDQKELYTQIICEKYPDLQVSEVDFIEHGQNNNVLMVNNCYIFRFPKYLDGVRQLCTEVTILNAIYQHITLPIPRFVFENVATQVVSESFAGYRLLPGEPLWRQTFQEIMDECVLANLAGQLARFLKQLHTIPVATLAVDSLARADTYEDCVSLYTRIKERCFPFMRPDAQAWACSHFEAFLAEPRHFSYVSVLKHGDFGASNILYNPQQRSITGIIDFGGMAIGDPAYDFAGLLSCYGEVFLRRLLDIYPEAELFWERIHFYRGTFILLEALFGLENDDPSAFESGIAIYR